MIFPPAILDIVANAKCLIKYNYFITVILNCINLFFIFYSNKLFKSFLILPHIGIIQPLNAVVYHWYVLGVESQYIKYYYYTNLLIFVCYNLSLIIYFSLLNENNFIPVEFIIMNLHFILIYRIYTLLYNLKTLT